MAKGTIHWVNYNKGYGYIIPADGSGNLFFERRIINKSVFNSLIPGTPVKYDKDMKNKEGPSAINIVIQPA